MTRAHLPRPQCMCVVVVVVVIIIIIIITATSCDCGWTLGPSGCYLGVNSANNYSDAVAECHSRGAYLADIKTQADYDLVLAEG